MGLLTDHDLAVAMERGTIDITPFEPAHLGPASYDVTLSPWVRRPHPGVRSIDLAAVPSDHTVLERVDGPIVMEPGEFLLASTVERLSLGLSFAARYEGRSSVARLGLASHITAGFIDPGFEGTITLEFANHSPWELTLHPGMRIGQLCFFRMERATRTSYATKGSYQDQEGPVESRLRIA